MKNLIYILLASIVFISCDRDEFLEPTPYGIATDEVFFRHEADAILAINSAYFNLRQWAENFDGEYGWGNIGTDDAWKGGASPADQDNLTAKENYTIIPTTGVPGHWGTNYEGIRRANKVLERVPEIEDIDPAIQDRIIGEAYFLRGIFYFDLVKYWGGVPIFRENLADLNDYLTVPRASQAETYAFVEENLLAALPKLPKKSEYSADNIGRATKGAALGFLIRINAYQGNMGAVKSYSEQLFALNEYELAPTYGEIFEPEGENGPGSIFEIQIHEAGQGWGPRLGNASGHAYGPRSGGSYGGWGFTMARQELMDEFETNDPRFDHSFYNVPDQPYAPLDGVNSYFGRKVAYAPYSDYPIPAAANDGGVNWRVIRLADIYLLYAESVYQTNPGTAIQYVNMVRARAREGGDPNTVLPDLDPSLTGQALLDAIYKERRVELNLEGLRFHDLIRTGRTNLLAPYGFQTGKHELFPIHQDEIDDYKNNGGSIQQNPGYSE